MAHEPIRYIPRIGRGMYAAALTAARTMICVSCGKGGKGGGGPRGDIPEMKLISVNIRLNASENARWKIVRATAPNTRASSDSDNWTGRCEECTVERVPHEGHNQNRSWRGCALCDSE